MSVAYETIVNVPENFIEKIFEDAIKPGCTVSSRLKDNKFSMLSWNYPYKAVDDLIEFSNKHSETVFTATTVCEMTPEMANIFEVSNGKVLSARQDIWFEIMIDKVYLSHIDPEIFAEFEKDVRKYFNAVDMDLVKNHRFDSFWELYKEHCSDLVYEYRNENVVFNAKREDVYSISVDVTIHGDPNNYDQFQL